VGGATILGVATVRRACLRILKIWLNDNRGSVYEHCRIIANWHALYKKAEPPENNWALAPMDQWKRYARNLCFLTSQ
jgi:hypothetical protein